MGDIVFNNGEFASKRDSQGKLHGARLSLARRFAKQTARQVGSRLREIHPIKVHLSTLLLSLIHI